MKEYRVSHLEMSETYGGVYAYETINDLNRRRIHAPKNNVRERFGEDRPIWEEIGHLNVNQRLPKYYFIAWVEKDNILQKVDEDGELYFGFHLFIVGYIETMEEVFSAVDSTVKKRFDERAQGYFP